MNNQFFQTLLTKKARYLNGENPSPAKLSAVNAQIESAFSVIEGFLGNGTDYLITSNSNRRVLPNISSAIGSGEKIYRPVNMFHSLEQIARKSIIASSTYDSVNNVLNIGASAVTGTFHIPTGTSIGIYYQTNTNNSVTINYNSTGSTFPSSTSGYTWAFMPTMDATEAFVILCTGGLKIKSFVLSNTAAGINPIQNIYTNTLGVVNIAYSIPLANLSYFSVNTPCKWASTTRTGVTSDWICLSKTCNHCIGNKYNNLGAPLCTGAVSTAPGGSAPLSYVADSVTTEKTIQSPLLTVDNPYSAKYLPFKMYDNISEGSALPSNSLALYDTSNQSVPVIQNLDFYSANTFRGDIVYIKDQVGVSNVSNQYLLIGGGYGMSNMLWDILGLIKGY